METPKAVRVAEAYCYDAGAANAAKNLRAAVAELIAERDALREDVERLRAAAGYMARVWVLEDDDEQPQAAVDACVQRMIEIAAKWHDTPAPATAGILRGNADLVPTTHATLGRGT